MLTTIARGFSSSSRSFENPSRDMTRSEKLLMMTSDCSTKRASRSRLRNVDPADFTDGPALYRRHAFDGVRDARRLHRLAVDFGRRPEAAGVEMGAVEPLGDRLELRRGDPELLRPRHDLLAR